MTKRFIIEENIGNTISQKKFLFSEKRPSNKSEQ